MRRRAAAAAARERREQVAAKQPRRRLRTRRQGARASLVVLAALAFGAWYGNRQVWFLGTDDGGRVALYRGLPYELPFGIELYEERYASPIQTESLPPRRREAVTGHDLRSRDDAVSLIEDIEEIARGSMSGHGTGSCSPSSRSPCCSPPASPRSSPRRARGSTTSA